MPKVTIHGNQLILPDDLREVLTSAENDPLDAEEVDEGIRLKCSPAARRRAAAYIWVLFETLNAVPNSAPNYNGTPTQQLPVVRLDEEGHRSLDLLR